jgi:hypothetical protein
VHDRDGDSTGPTDKATVTTIMPALTGASRHNDGIVTGDPTAWAARTRRPDTGSLRR